MVNKLFFFPEGLKPSTSGCYNKHVFPETTIIIMHRSPFVCSPTPVLRLISLRLIDMNDVNKATVSRISLTIIWIGKETQHIQYVHDFMQLFPAIQEHNPLTGNLI